MTPDEQAQFTAMRAEYEQLILNISHQCADRAMVIAALQCVVKEQAAQIEAMKPKPEPASAS